MAARYASIPAELLRPAYKSMLGIPDADKDNKINLVDLATVGNGKS